MTEADARSQSARQIRCDNIRRALSARSMALFGGTYLTRSIEELRSTGYDGRVYVVNPRHREIAGVATLPSVEALPEIPDLALLAIGAEATIETLRDLRALGTPGAVCYAHQFAEVGGAGALRQRLLVEAAGDMAVFGPNCPGFVNYLDRIMACFGDYLSPFRERGVAVITQSGSVSQYAVHGDRNCPLAYIINLGNQAVVSAADTISAVLDDPRVTAIGIYLESLVDTQAFSQVALRAVELEKPIVILSPGRSARGRRAAQSHTAAITGDSAVLDSICRRYGIIRAKTMSEWIEILKLIDGVGVPTGNRAGILTCSGAECGLAADAAEAAGVELPDLTEAQTKALDVHLSGHVVPGNPLDSALVTWGNREIQMKCYSALLSENVDLGLLLIDYLHGPSTSPPGNWDAALLSLADAIHQTGTPGVVVSSLPDGLTAHGRRVAEDCGLTVLYGIDDGLAAFGQVAAYGRRRVEMMAAGLQSIAHLGTGVPHKPDRVETLNEADSKAALEAAGLAVPHRRVCGMAAVGDIAAELGFPVVLKALVPDLVHKSDAGGVALGLSDAEAVGCAAEEMAARMNPSPEAFLVERMVEGAVCELILGVVSDPRIGPVLVLGSGGILTELVSDRVALPVPSNAEEIHAALRSLRVFRLLEGFRGRPAGDAEAVVSAALALAAFAHERRDRIFEIDLNPLIVLPEGAGCLVADAVIRQSPAAPASVAGTGGATASEETVSDGV